MALPTWSSGKRGTVEVYPRISCRSKRLSQWNAQIWVAISSYIAGASKASPKSMTPSIVIPSFLDKNTCSSCTSPWTLAVISVSKCTFILQKRGAVDQCSRLRSSRDIPWPDLEAEWEGCSTSGGVLRCYYSVSKSYHWSSSAEAWPAFQHSRVCRCREFLCTVFQC